MNAIGIAHRRLHNLRLADDRFDAPEQAVGWLLAVQSQDYGPARWSLGERTAGCTDTDVERAFAEGAILRTHVLRPTWHFVLPEDIRWMQELTAPRVHAQNAYQYRQTGLEDGLRIRCTRLLDGALRGGSHLTRKELEAVLQRAGVAAAAGLGMVYILMDAELNGLICSGAPRGRQQTYALLEERAPGARSLTPDRALEELVVRYFISHGPATEKDLRWWSSLPLAQIRRGLEMAAPSLRREEHGGVAYWSASADAPAPPPSPRVHLLQGYDEYFVGYQESRDVIGGDWGRATPESPAYLGAVVLDSQLVGRWKRTVARQSVSFQVVLSRAFNDAQMRALHDAADRHGAFLGLPATVQAAAI